MLLRCGSRSIDLALPAVMGVLNVTPDSFSDGGQWNDVGRALHHAEEMVGQGAAIIDVGGESTRPRAVAIPVDEELRRVMPVITALTKRIAVPISIDTSRPEVMRAALDAGATLINDVRALSVPGAMEVAASSSAAVCIMHMQGDPQTMQDAPIYKDVVDDVRQALAERAADCQKAGIGRDRLVIDPGIGFGKRVEDNLRLIAALADFVPLGFPILVGISRKSTIGAITGRPVEQRLAGSIAFATAAALAGASIIRAHDVAATVDAVKVATSLRAVKRG